MAIQPSYVNWSELRWKTVEVGRLYDDGFLYLNDYPGVWIQSNPDSVSSVRSLELNLYGYKEESKGDSIGELSQLTHLSIRGGCHLKCLPNTLSMLHHLHHLELYGCYKLRWLPWSITNLSNLRFLYLTREFRIETLPPHLDDSIIISVEYTHIRKTWKELKTQITEIPIIREELAAQKTSTHGYLQFKGDPALWIHDYNNYGLLSSLRVLDLDLLGDWGCKGKIPYSIGELPQLTHLYISNGYIPHHLPPTFSRLTHLSLITCTFECHTISHFDSLGNLSTLTSLHLNLEWDEELPKHIDLPISLTHLSLECCYSSIPDSFMASMAKLSNLNTLTLSWCCDLESLPLHLNLTKLILRNTTIKSLPIGLKHLEIIYDNRLQDCWENQLVNLETLSYTCSEIESLLSLTSLHNLRELQLKDCFRLKELPQDLDKLVKLCTLDVSGTRIQSLPSSIINLYNLQCLILPKCFILKSLPDDFGNKVMISVDDTDESYYKYQGYHDLYYGIIKDCDYMTSDSINEINEKFLEKFKQATVIEQASPHRPSNHQPDATRIIEGSLLNGSADPTCNNNHNGLLSSLTQEMEILPTRNKAGTKPDVVAEFFSNALMDFEVFNTDFFNFPYRNNIPAVIMDNLVGWKDVEADGNCGFRCVAEVFHGGQENWPMARRAILNELKAHPDVYQKIYRDDYDSALKRIDWNDGQCGEDHYMAIVADLYTIANCYQCPVMCFSMNGLDPHLSATVFPWNVGAHSTKPTKKLIIAHLGTYKHYILLDLKDNFPVPPILSLWYGIRNETVVDWDSPYLTRMQRWKDRLTNRSQHSIHLDVSNDCNVNGGNNPIVENISHTNFSSHIQETQILQPNNKDGVIAVETSSKLHETNFSGESSQQAFQNGGVLKQGTSSIDLRISAHGGSDNRASVKRQNKNPQGGNVKHKNQKIEIPIVRKTELKSENMTVEEGAIHIGDCNANGGNNAVGENISHTNFSSHNHETEILQINSWDGAVIDVDAEPSSKLHETNLSRENSQQAFPNGGIDNINLESEQGTSSSDSPNFAHGGSDNRALVKRRYKNPQDGKCEA